MEAKPSPSRFFQAIFARWFTAMSGPLSVPATIAAVFVQSDIQRICFALTAIACLVFTAYWIWKAERNKVIVIQTELEELQSAPKLELRFDRAHVGCFEHTGDAPKRCLTVRILPITPHRVENCVGQLLRIMESDDGMKWAPTNYIDALFLRWTHQKTDDQHKSMRIARDVQQTLDVFYIGEMENALRLSLVGGYPRRPPDFQNGKWFRFDVKVSGDDNAEDLISLRVKRGGRWNDTIVEKISP